MGKYEKTKYLNRSKNSYSNYKLNFPFFTKEQMEQIKKNLGGKQKMEIKKANEIPCATKELNKENTTLITEAGKMKIGEVIEVTPTKGKEAKHMVTGFKNAVKRLLPNQYKFRVRNNKVFVQRTEDKGNEKKPEEKK